MHEAWVRKLLKKFAIWSRRFGTLGGLTASREVKCNRSNHLDRISACVASREPRVGVVSRGIYLRFEGTCTDCTRALRLITEPALFSVIVTETHATVGTRLHLLLTTATASISTRNSGRNSLGT